MIGYLKFDAMGLLIWGWRNVLRAHSEGTEEPVKCLGLAPLFALAWLITLAIGYFRNGEPCDASEVAKGAYG